MLNKMVLLSLGSRASQGPSRRKDSAVCVDSPRVALEEHSKSDVTARRLAMTSPRIAGRGVQAFRQTVEEAGHNQPRELATKGSSRRRGSGAGFGLPRAKSEERAKSDANSRRLAAGGRWAFYRAVEAAGSIEPRRLGKGGPSRKRDSAASAASLRV